MTANKIASHFTSAAQYLKTSGNGIMRSKI